MVHIVLSHFIQMSIFSNIRLSNNQENTVAFMEFAFNRS